MTIETPFLVHLKFNLFIEQFHIILQVWTPNVVTLWEALSTVLQFGLLLIHAYVQDKRWPYMSLPLYVWKHCLVFTCLFLENLSCIRNDAQYLIQKLSISDTFHAYLHVPRARSERPEDWVPEEAESYKEVTNTWNECSETFQVSEDENRNIVDIFSIHSNNGAGSILKCFLQCSIYSFMHCTMLN